MRSAMPAHPVKTVLVHGGVSVVQAVIAFTCRCSTNHATQSLLHEPAFPLA